MSARVEAGCERLGVCGALVEERDGTGGFWHVQVPGPVEEVVSQSRYRVQICRIRYVDAGFATATTFGDGVGME